MEYRFVGAHSVSDVGTDAYLLDRIMRKIVVIYFSANGTTAKLAEAIHAGAAEITEVVSHRIASADIVDGRFEMREF